MKVHQKLSLAVSISALSLFGLLAAGSANAEPGITSNTIVIGQSAGFTGTAAEEVKQATAGAQLYFDIVNKQGGVFGRKIVLESLDDGFEPKRTVENTRKLLNEKNAFALFLYRGTPTTESILGAINDAKVPLIAPVSGATSLHEPMQHYLFNVRSKYRDEVGTAIEQLSGMGLQRYAVLVSNDSFGNDALEGLKQAIKKYKLPEPVIANYERNTVAVEGAVKKIFDAKPQAVLMICTAKPCAAFIKQYREAGGQQQLITLSNVSSQVFLQSLGKDARGLGMTQVFPNPRSSSTQISKEFMTALKTRSELSDSYPTLEGYISAKILVEGLRRAGNKPTRESLVSGLEGMGGYDIGGMSLKYGPNSRDGLNFIELTVIGKDGYVLR
ncbi:ABC transporter substrate-binding protein [Collimonas pratensis]|uniref:Receptor ligand binding region family protein n=1 Tax=Collimonas pratensis TaxID=279113 RepID=A0ABN4MCB6_9BURK|nr:ABC transporter substrate-binding protein [Collimonas pratensis]AMP15371.1 receptor ligand binding region family protein [Collimonas pratensis]